MKSFPRLPALRSRHRTRVSAKNGAFPQLEIKSHWRSLRLRTDDGALESYFASWPRSFGTRLPVLRTWPEVRFWEVWVEENFGVWFGVSAKRAEAKKRTKHL